METEEADRRNRAAARQVLADLKADILAMLEVDSDQVMWLHIGNLAHSAAEIQDKMHPDIEE